MTTGDEVNTVAVATELIIVVATPSGGTVVVAIELIVEVTRPIATVVVLVTKPDPDGATTTTTAPVEEMVEMVDEPTKVGVERTVVVATNPGT